MSKFIVMSSMIFIKKKKEKKKKRNTIRDTRKQLRYPQE